jgi:hypothetical protein
MAMKLELLRKFWQDRNVWHQAFREQLGDPRTQQVFDFMLQWKSEKEISEVMRPVWGQEVAAELESRLLRIEMVRHNLFRRFLQG